MLIYLKNVSYAYKKSIPVLANINMEVSQNQIHAVLGHNGAGKTTLFKLISGNLKLKNGCITFNSNFVDNKRDIAFVPDTGGFFGSLTVWENLRFRYLISNQPENDMRDRINLLINMFGLTEYVNIQGKNLSSGLKKRLSLACAMVLKPKVLLLDEPTNGVDPTTYDMLIKILNKLKAKGTHILLNSHDLTFVSRVADDITILHKGEIVCQRTMDKLDEEKLSHLYFENTEKVKDELYEDI